MKQACKHLARAIKAKDKTSQESDDKDKNAEVCRQARISKLLGWNNLARPMLEQAIASLETEDNEKTLA